MLFTCDPNQLARTGTPCKAAPTVSTACNRAAVASCLNGAAAVLVNTPRQVPGLVLREKPLKNDFVKFQVQLPLFAAHSFNATAPKVPSVEQSGNGYLCCKENQNSKEQRPQIAP